MKSWKTTVLGVLGAVLIIATESRDLLDDDPATTFELEPIIAALAVLGVGVAARDNDKSSQDVGIRP